MELLLLALSFGLIGDLHPWAPTSLEVERVSLQVFDLSGALVFDSGLRKGHAIQWNLETRHGRPAANGTYLYIITVQDRAGNLIRSGVRLISVIR